MRRRDEGDRSTVRRPRRLDAFDARVQGAAIRRRHELLRARAVGIRDPDL
jgi:hypothetical protein